MTKLKNTNIEKDIIIRKLVLALEQIRGIRWNRGRWADVAERLCPLMADIAQKALKECKGEYHNG